MSLTILELLENADYNLQNAKMDFQIKIGKDQLHNALEKLNEGKTLEDDYED